MSAPASYGTDLIGTPTLAKMLGLIEKLEGYGESHGAPDVTPALSSESI